MYLDPQNGKEPMFNAAVQLLHNHGESLDPLQVLEVMELVFIIDVEVVHNPYIRVIYLGSMYGIIDNKLLF